MNCIEKQKQLQTRSCDGEAIYVGEDEYGTHPTGMHSCFYLNLI